MNFALDFNTKVQIVYIDFVKKSLKSIILSFFAEISVKKNCPENERPDSICLR